MAEITQELVDQNLNAALTNHYDNIKGWTATDIAWDLMAYSDDFCDVDDYKQLLPYVKDCKARNK